MTPGPERARRTALRLPLSPAWGAGLALLTALISGVAIYLNAFAVRQVADPAVFTTLKNGVAAVALIALLGAGGRAELRSLPARRWAGLLALGVVGGSVPFLLFFTGLAQVSAPGAAFIHKTLFVWVALLAVPLLGERLGWAQFGAIGLLFVAQLVVAPPAGVRWGSGETLIAMATLLWAAEIIVAKRLLGSMGARVAAAGRMGFGIVFLVAYLALTGRLAAVAALDAVAWGWVLVSGLLLTGYVATWYAALQRAPATLVTSVLVLGAVVTAGIQALASGIVPRGAPLAGYALIVAVAAGIALVGVRRTRSPSRV